MKTTRITVETETWTIVHRAKVGLGWCPECCAEASVITLDPQSLADPGNATEVERWLGTGKLHLWRSANASTQLCVNSLLECFDREQMHSLVDLGENTTT